MQKNVIKQCSFYKAIIERKVILIDISYNVNVLLTNSIISKIRLAITGLYVIVG